MPKLLKDGILTENTWALMPKTENPDTEVPTGHIIVPLNVWLVQKDNLHQRADVGVWLDSDETPEPLADHVQHLPLIAVNFPVFTDGRSFTHARLLRERYGFTGELRAIGYFLAEQVCFLHRCGVNAFDFGSEREQHLDAAQSALNDFTEFYQGAVDQPLPLFRRRA